MKQPSLVSSLALVMGAVFCSEQFIHAAMANETAAASNEAKTGNDTHITVPGLIISVFDGVHVRGILTVDVTLQVALQQDRDAVYAILPRLRDRYVVGLTRMASNRVQVDRPVDLDTITRLLQKITNDVIGADTAKVLLGSATVRPL